MDIFTIAALAICVLISFLFVIIYSRFNRVDRGQSLPYFGITSEVLYFVMIGFVNLIQLREQVLSIWVLSIINISFIILLLNKTLRRYIDESS